MIIEYSFDLIVNAKMKKIVALFVLFNNEPKYYEMQKSETLAEFYCNFFVIIDIMVR